MRTTLLKHLTRDCIKIVSLYDRNTAPHTAAQIITHHHTQTSKKAQFNKNTSPYK